ncbi:hypothetical protein [Aureispira anguillae]|uniref:PH domain-containing protein n=1 Tax=Aureispira anguillae TaxID=2864201 RepID=A0A915YI04_9BACT|nr:hypothetical protein [Aureispira anguillae]BDS13433.1 hypothetical protein AsAng_0041700 [Aureispira anguillae]
MHHNILDDFSPSENIAQREVYRHLNEKEQLIWAGRPKQKIIFEAADGCLIPFSLIWGGFAIFWEIMAITTNAGILLILFGIPFVLIGLYGIFGRFIHKSWVRKRTFYGVTEQRIIVVRNNRVYSTNLSQISDIQVNEDKDGSGTLIFALRAFNNSPTIQDLKKIPALIIGRSFQAIPNVQFVYQQIQKLRKK